MVTPMPETYFIVNEEHAVSLKLPTFWTNQPEVWFVQAEAQFNFGGITASDMKYFYILAALNQETVTRLLDLINRPRSTTSTRR